MAKQPKQATSQAPVTKSLPDMYKDLSIRSDLNKVCIVEDNHMLFYMFESPQACHLVSQAIQKKWDGMEGFLNENKQTILAYHENLLKNNPPEGQSNIDTGRYVWYKICSLAIDRRPAPTAIINARKSTIGLCEYRLGKETDFSSVKTHQAKKCIDLFQRALKSDKAKIVSAPNPADGGKTTVEDRHILEVDLRDFIIANAGELHTRQDPWRIFQYYRPIMIEGKFITRK